ncbi:MAG: acyltransferase [Oscillospiraceae bacterium]|nr:acyltransferase [Oscillospiraceae bacterium]
MGRIKWFDAVRAYGLFLVLFYHLFYDFLPGGFLGVDVFLAFSGFLITANIIEEIRRSEKFDFFDYCKRRIRRIMIPLLFTIVFTLPLLLLVSPDYSVGIARQTAAALSFVTNWYQILTGGSYEARLLPSYYVHTWTLAILMQLYIVWGLGCLIIHLFSKALFSRNSGKMLVCFRIFSMLVSGCAAAFSFMYMQRLLNLGYELDTIYFSTLTRSFSFLLGSCAATIRGINIKVNTAAVPRFTKLKTMALLIFTLLAATVICYCSMKYKFEDEFIYRYGFMLTTIMTIAMIYGTLGLHIMTPERVKEPRPLTAIADVSYNAYLYHWPIYIIICAKLGKTSIASFVTIGLTFFISALMLYKGERVFVAQGSSGALKHRKLAATFLSLAVLVSIAPGLLVLSRAPDITSMEKDFASNYVIQDVQRAIRTSNRMKEININPVAYIKGENTYSYELVISKVQALESQVDVLYVETDGDSELIDELNDSTLAHEESDLSQTVVVIETAANDVSPNNQPPYDTDYIWDPKPTNSGSASDSSAGLDSGYDIPNGVTIIGCSVALGARNMLLESIADSYVDTEGSRQLGAGYNLMMELQNNGELREYVVIALGTNVNSAYETLITNIINDLNPGHRLVFVTPFDGRYLGSTSTSVKTAEYMRTLPDLYSFVTVADWHSLVSTQTSLLASDNVHMGGDSSRRLLTNCIIEALEVAANKPAK